VTTNAGFAVWLTGLPASGKSTLAEGLASELHERGMRVQILDSDKLRSVLTPEPTYSPEERSWFYQVVAFIAHLLTQNSVNVVIAATADRRRYRDHARQLMERFAEIFVKCSLATCMTRDEKGIYEKALAGQAATVPGLQVPYEPPLDPAAVVDTEETSPQEGVQQIVTALERLSFLQQGEGCFKN
jgi:adenylylsulfate kinase